MAGVTRDELVYIATRMAQELLEHAEAAERLGCPAQGAVDLVNEWEGIYGRMGLGWKRPMAGDDDEPTLLNNL